MCCLHPPLRPRSRHHQQKQQELAAILPPSVAPAVDTSKLLQEVKPEIPGKMSRKEYQAVLDKVGRRLGLCDTQSLSKSVRRSAAG